MDSISFHGRGLHSGAYTRLTLSRHDGPLCFVHGDQQVRLGELRVVRSDRGVCVRADGLEVDLVEHLFSALAGLGVRHGVALEVSGPEIPLLDGAALELAHALRALGVPTESPPRLAVKRAGELVVGDASYRFEPAQSIGVEVEVSFDGVGTQQADWDGSAAQYLARIAPARTFGFQRDAESLAAGGRARYLDPTAIIVLDDAGRAVAPFAAPGPGELARHKLLDLLGDSFVYGGPPRGRVSARRPGHTNNHAAMRKALEIGLIGRV